MNKTVISLIVFFTISVYAKPSEVQPHKVVTYTELPFEEVSFVKDVKPIVQSRCATCHYDGGKLLNLLQYSVAKENGSKIRDNMISGKMPLRNLTGISDMERYVLRRWVDKGMKE